jgi:hypothetical protein
MSKNENPYQREWKAIREELGNTADEQHLAIRLGLELLQEMTDDPIYRAEREHRDRVAEYKREQRERRELLEMTAADRLTHAVRRNEVSVRLTATQSRAWVGYQRIVVAVPADEPASFMADDESGLRALPWHDEHTWDLAWYTDGSTVATLARR